LKAEDLILYLLCQPITVVIETRILWNLHNWPGVQYR